MAPLLSSLASLYLLFAPPDSVIEPVEIQPPVAPTPSFERRSFTNDPIGV